MESSPPKVEALLHAVMPVMQENRTPIEYLLTQIDNATFMLCDANDSSSLYYSLVD